MIRIAWMYPDTLYLHGERGTILALQRVCGMLGMECRTDRIDMGKSGFDPMDYDIVFYGPGEVPSFPAVIEEISSYRDRLISFTDSGRVLLVTGSSVAMFGDSISLLDSTDNRRGGSGDAAKGLGIIPVRAREREYIYGNDEYISAVYNGKEMELVGNQIQMTDIEYYEKQGFSHLGKVIYGRGDNGKDGFEGILYRNSVFTNMTGPLLVGNPWLTAEMIKCAAASSGKNSADAELWFDMELKSLELKKKFILDKAASDKQNAYKK